MEKFQTTPIIIDDYNDDEQIQQTKFVIDR